jgi:cell division protein FtsB
MQKIIFICAILILFKINYDIYFVETIRDSKLLELIKINQGTNQKLQDRNNILLEKISAMKGNNIALEARARYELNLVKRGETLLVLPDNYTFKLNKNQIKH